MRHSGHSETTFSVCELDRYCGWRNRYQNIRNYGSEGRISHRKSSDPPEQGFKYAIKACYYLCLFPIVEVFLPEFDKKSLDNFITLKETASEIEYNQRTYFFIHFHKVTPVCVIIMNTHEG